MEYLLVAALCALGLGSLIGVTLLYLKLAKLSSAASQEAIAALGRNLAEQLTKATADTAERLERTKGDLRQQLSDRIQGDFIDVREALGRDLAQGRREQADTLKLEIDSLRSHTSSHLEAIRATVDQKLETIGVNVDAKLDQNIREGFQHFERVQQHLQAAEEQLRNVGVIGASINDLNNLLKLPHLRGRFGEASLERLLADFLPASMYEFQAAAGSDGQGRADAVIKFPGRVLPIDAKFPREQVMPLFEAAEPASLGAARQQFARIMKEQGRRISAYIRPENGTTDLALMYLPSETLYMEVVLNGELCEWLNRERIFPVSPNTLIVTLSAIAMVFQMYEFAKGYENATEELRKAQKSFASFGGKFDEVGRSLGKAQEAFSVASGHLARYRNRVVSLSGEPVPELAEPPSPAESDKDS
jgi:DNA recombination protein RmuC